MDFFAHHFFAKITQPEHAAEASHPRQQALNPSLPIWSEATLPIRQTVSDEFDNELNTRELKILATLSRELDNNLKKGDEEIYATLSHKLKSEIEEREARVLLEAYHPVFVDKFECNGLDFLRFVLLNRDGSVTFSL